MTDFDTDSFFSPKLKGVSMVITTKKDMTKITFETGVGMNEWLTNPLKIMDGRTIGQANRDELHQRLDALLDHHLTKEAT